MLVNGQKTNGYNAEQIQILEGLEAVRKRPSMYIGSTDHGPSSSGLRSCEQQYREAMAGFAIRSCYFTPEWCRFCYR